MATLADAIERYIKDLFEQTAAEWVEIRRAELAVRFSCVPSQISYVLETRFTPERGYAVQTRRGGGGYVRILRLPVHHLPGELARWAMARVGSRISVREADAVIDRLVDAGLLSSREAAVWRATLRWQTEWAPPALRDQVRASLLLGAMAVKFADLMSEGSLREGTSGGADV